MNAPQPASVPINGDGHFFGQTEACDQPVPASTPSCSILHLEDNQLDAEQVRSALQSADIVCQMVHVKNREQYVAALTSGHFDLILADNSLPSFDGMSALDIAKRKCPDVPFIFLSGTMDEQHTAESFQHGAADYVPEDNLARLAPSIRRVIDGIRERDERHRAEMELDRFFSLSVDLLCIVGFDGYLKRINPAWEKVLGHPLNRLQSESLILYIHPEDRQSTASQLAAMQKHGQSASFESRFLCADGSHVWLQWNAMPLPNEQSIYASARDITERRKSEEALRLSEARTRAVIVSSLDCVITMDHDGRIMEFNPAAEKTFGYDRGDAIGKPMADLIQLPLAAGHPPEDFNRFLESANGQILDRRIETTARHWDGSEFHVELAISRIDCDGDALFTACLRDITDRRRAELEIQKLAAFPRLNPYAVLEITADGSISYFNEAALNIAKSLGQNHPSQILPADSTSIVKSCLAFGQSKLRYETTFGKRILSWSFYPVTAGGVVHCYASDITDRKQSEEQILEQAALLDKAQDAILVRDLEHRIIYWNKSCEKVFGWTEQEVATKSAIELTSKADGPRFFEALQTVLEKGEWSGELHHPTKAGGEVVVESRWTLVRDSQGHPKSILVLSTDITERRKFESQFLRAQRLESIGTLASGIAHDLNNILAPIMMSVNLLEESNSDPRHARLLETLRTGVQRGAEMVKQILSFTRGQEGARNLINLKHLISEISKIIGETFPKKIQVKTSVCRDLWTIMADTTQVHQVLMNLCVNARDAMPDGGTLTIQAENLLLDPQFVECTPETKPGAYLILTVADTGSGIPPEIMEKIWEPFFTMKPQGMGTGLGLSTVLSIVKAHGGFIRTESEPGKGTRFRIFLPAAEARAKAAATEKVSAPPVGHGEKILVIDDERAFQEITKAIFNKYGYRVLTANDGTEALALFAQHKDDIDLVMTDMVMPFLDGPATINALRRLDPNVRIIAASGLSENEHRAAELTNSTFLLKPFTTETLLTTVDRVLKSPAHISN